MGCGNSSDKNTIQDPYFDLIMDPDLEKNEWSPIIDQQKAQPKHSLAIKHINKALFEELKEIKTQQSGWTVARAINTSVRNPESQVGIHAGDIESYKVFAKLFNPIIEEYHKGYKVDGSMKHITDMDSSKINVELAAKAQRKIISTRIRCARNLSAFPLNTGGTKFTRMQIADLMEKVCAGFPKDLQGTFYRHTTMSKKQTQELIDDHFLFKGKDAMQASSGYHQDWPHGRGIFVSADKKFLLWINEGDHIRIISMEQGGDVKSVFERLARGVKCVEEGLQKIKGLTNVFQNDPILGQITCCPSNLGTGLRGSVHIALPNLIKAIGQDKINDEARSRNCQARGTMGEHTEVVDRIDISNWRRLGFSEFDLVKDMINCANAFSKMEDDLVAKLPKDPYFDLIMNKQLDDNVWADEIDRQKKLPKHSLAIKYISKELFNELKEVTTKQAGWTLARAINTSVMNPESQVGCHAGDLESYRVFSKLFNPIIEDYHKGYKTDGSMKHITDMDSSKIGVKLEENAKKKIVSTRIRCARNLSSFPLNTGGTKETRIQIADLMEKVCAGFPKDLSGTFYRHTTMSDKVRQELIDDHFLFKGKDAMQASSGYHQDWPHGRGIFVSADKKFILWINEGDHIRIISMEQGGDVKSVFERLAKGVKCVEEGLKKIQNTKEVFMSDPILGQISCCPSNLGTGLRGSVHIILPTVLKSVGQDKINDIAREMNCQARGTMGEHTEVVDRIDISNWRRLGFSEFNLVKDMINCANALSKLEDEEVLKISKLKESQLKESQLKESQLNGSQLKESKLAESQLAESQKLEKSQVAEQKELKKQGKSKIDWKLVNSKLPVGTEKDEVEKRKKLFNTLDNGNGLLSLSEISAGMNKVLALDGLFDCKKPLMRAFVAGKNSVKSTDKNKKDDDYIQRSEFRYFLLYLRQYFEYWVMFDSIDTSDDQRIRISEFKQAIPIMKNWGVNLDNPEATFKQIDKNGAGFILFDEFSEYAIKASLDLATDEELKK